MFHWARFLLPVIIAGGTALATVGHADSASGSIDGASNEVTQNALLTVEIEGNSAATQRFTLSALREFEAVSFETETIWTDGVQQFTGVSLHHLISQFDVTEGVLHARAVNDYEVQIPLSDAIEGGPIIAYERNGKEMSLRSKGPLWIIYPYDSNPTYRTEVIYSRSIWQLDNIRIGPVAE